MSLNKSEKKYIKTNIIKSAYQYNINTCLSVYENQNKIKDYKCNIKVAFFNALHIYTVYTASATVCLTL